MISIGTRRGEVAHPKPEDIIGAVRGAVKGIGIDAEGPRSEAQDEFDAHHRQVQKERDRQDLLDIAALVRFAIGLDRILHRIGWLLNNRDLLNKKAPVATLLFCLIPWDRTS
jgi:hypothetical protein